MTKPTQLDLFPVEIHLRRIDSALNMQRFYTLHVAPTLFGEFCVVRKWGRIGTRGRRMTEWFDGPGAAHDALGRLERVKRRRGYR